MKIAIALFVVAQVLLSQDVSSQSIQKCTPKACPRNYAPVCDTNGKTHSNKCEFKNYQCNNPSVKIAYKGECKTSGPGCAVILCPADKICVEKPSPCQIPPCPVKAQCVPNTPKPTKITCGPAICPAVYKPVCASNGKTYGNSCEFKAAACLDPSLTIVHEGECEKTGSGCDAVRCMAGYQCVENPTAQCVPAPGSLCAATTCLEGSQCVEETLPCLVPPCPIEAKCVANTCTKECGEFQECAVYEGEEYCRDTCAAGTCTKGEVCTLEEVQCIRAPCPPIAKCSKGSCDDIVCIALYKPVCGSDGKTYDNSCKLSIASCRDPSITQVSEGECGKKSAI